LKVKKRIPKKRREIKVKFEAKGLTARGGLLLIEELIHQFKVREHLDRNVCVKKRERGFDESDHILSLAYNMIAGGSRLEDVNMLREDEETKEIIQQKAIPHPTTAGDFLRSFSPGHIAQLEKALCAIQKRVHSKEKAEEVTLDIDSSIFEQYSDQKQGSCMAYTGKIGYHPQLGFRADTGEWVYGKLQRGSAYTARKAKRLLEKCLERLPKSVKRVKTRSDSGWYQHPYLESCEQCTTHEVIYSITAPQTKRLMETVKAIKEWIPMSDDEDETRFVGECYYVGRRWKKARRYIVKRDGQPRDEHGQLLLPFEESRYHVMVTNSTEENIVSLMEFHKGRGNMENYIKELMYGFDLEQFPTGSFHANWVYLLIGQLAYNLVVWLKQYGLPKQYLQSRVKQIRYRFLNLAGSIVHTARGVWLNLKKGYLHQKEFLQTLERLRALEFA
jgi:hypothetical protein